LQAARSASSFQPPEAAYFTSDDALRYGFDGHANFLSQAMIAMNKIAKWPNAEGAGCRLERPEVQLSQGRQPRTVHSMA
jgi:hypothetical protein